MKSLSPFVFTIFGAFGNLAQKSLYPALYALAKSQLLPEDFLIMGYGRSNCSKEQFRTVVKKAILARYPEAKENEIQQISSRCLYMSGSYDEVEGFKAMEEVILAYCKEKHWQRLVYFAVPPVVFHDIVTNLSQSQQCQPQTKLLFEKPFGMDLEDASALYHHIAQNYHDDQIYLLDHYLGKAPVQSILFLRQANRLLEPLLNGRDIANIQISLLEEEGIEDRAGYYERMGALKDMVQSHVLQLLALSTMAIPITKSPESIHREKIAMLNALRLDQKKGSCVLGQYETYQNEANVDEHSHTETFVSLKASIDKEEWFGVPIYIRTGKKTGTKGSRVVIELKKFAHESVQNQPNRIIFELAPDPRLVFTLHDYTSDFDQGNIIPLHVEAPIACRNQDCLPEHARLLRHALLGERMYFVHIQEIFAGWKFLKQINTYLEQEHLLVEPYKDGSMGPSRSDDIPASDGFTWYNS